MNTRPGLYYSKEHEWVRVEGDLAYIGITDYAQESLGSIVYVETPKVGKAIGKDEVLGVVESVKAASDVFSPISGTVVEANESLQDSPELINEAPYENHIAVLKIQDPAELEQLFNDTQYEEYVKSQGA
ncbi:MAG: glycine cleavage system protein GcvH [Clostridiaceae bacterium]|nr:glycine cleavage system protein GcvH [Clostridiaceae bacterium]